MHKLVRHISWRTIRNSSCTREDWIVHQDEETRFDVETVRHVYYHCAAEQQAVAEGKRRYGRIGQGIIYYGINDEIENWVTTLADSIRVADDFGKFRIQFALHEPLIGMHGSFVVASHAVEQATTFDHGMLGSVTEDAYFALVARSLGVTFSHIDARMYEQSPFSIVDFAKQRKRWFAGLWLVAKAPLIPFKYRLGLLLLEIQWGWAPFMLPAALLVLTCKTNTSVGFKLVLALVSAYWCWAYVVGFLFTFSIRKLGVAKYCVLLWLQLVLQPLFALMEVWGVGWALVDREAFKGFHVVDKQSAALKARMEGRDAVQDTEMKPVSEGEESLLEKNAAAHRTDNRTKELTVAN
ncbi:Beta-1 [Diplonema papillatum]|nr:Beta-1 [Diplonema papillatum]KAJ9445474.1 Beta-1 [Diplonema papillatum]